MPILPGGCILRSDTVGSVGRVGIMLGVALPLAAVDLLVKVSMPTAAWAHHERSLGWLAFIAFNPADVFALAGIFALVVVIGVWLIRNRGLIPPPDEVRATRGRAFRRLFE